MEYLWVSGIITLKIKQKDIPPSIKKADEAVAYISL